MRAIVAERPTIADNDLDRRRYWGRGRGSGVEVSDRWFYAYRLRDGKIISWRSFTDALEAVGLEG